MGEDVRGAPDRPALRGRLERDHRPGDRGELPAAACACSTRSSSSSRFVHGRAAGRVATSGCSASSRSSRGFDPTPTAVALEIAPRVVAWVDVVEDLSGLEPTERGLDRARRDPRHAARAARRGRPRVRAVPARERAPRSRAAPSASSATIDGRPWVQQPFPYQGKCLQWLREGRTRARARRPPRGRRRARGHGLRATLRGVGLESQPSLRGSSTGARRSCLRSGSERMRLPVAAKTAFATAAAIGGVPGSPAPPVRAPDSRICHLDHEARPPSAPSGSRRSSSRPRGPCRS